MFNVSFRRSTFESIERDSKSFPQLTFLIDLNILNICFTVIPYFTDIFWWERYTDVNLAIDDIVMAFVKNGSINTIFRNNNGTKRGRNGWAE